MVIPKRSALAYLNQHNRSNVDLSVLIKKVDDISRYGEVEIGNNNIAMISRKNWNL